MVLLQDHRRATGASATGSTSRTRRHRPGTTTRILRIQLLLPRLQLLLQSGRAAAGTILLMGYYYNDYNDYY